MKLSIIIPAYNSEKFIEKCLLSCLNQDISHNEYELIVVDDGSTDNTKNIVLSIKKKHNNIVYIYQENSAQGAARNNGLSKAKGEYIWFVDSDDWIAENSLGKICNRLINEKLDGILVGHATQYATLLDIWENFDEKQVATGKEILKNNKFYISPTYAVWKRSYLEHYNIKYIEHLYHEDSEICPRMFYYAKKIGYIKDICYYVFPNLNSTTRGINPQRAFDIVTVVKNLERFRQTIKDKDIDLQLINYISMTINSSLYNTYKLNKEQIKKLDRLWYDHKYLYNVLKKSNILKYKVEGILFTLVPKRISRIYKLIQYLNRNPGNMNKQKVLLNQ